MLWSLLNPLCSQLFLSLNTFSATKTTTIHLLKRRKTFKQRLVSHTVKWQFGSVIKFLFFLSFFFLFSFSFFAPFSLLFQFQNRRAREKKRIKEGKAPVPIQVEETLARLEEEVEQELLQPQVSEKSRIHLVQTIIRQEELYVEDDYEFDPRDVHISPRDILEMQERERYFLVRKNALLLLWDIY
jgi:hypothetical protein